MSYGRKEQPGVRAAGPEGAGGAGAAGWSRRRFLGAAASAAGMAFGSRRGAAGRAGTWPNQGGPKRSRVVQARSDYVVRGQDIHEAVLDELLESSLTRLTGAATSQAAWQRLLAADDVIGLKFNRSAQETLGTTPAVARSIVRSLRDAGFAPGQIVCIELPEHLRGELGCAAPAVGFEPGVVDFGSGADRLARTLSQVSVLITVPFLKTHNIAGMTCALKNLSHGLIKHPARYHENGCSPYIADIVALPQIRSRLRLCIVDALRVVYEGGPDPVGDTIAEAGTLLVSTDPAAVEAVGLGMMNDIRSGYNLAPIGGPAEDLGYLGAAARRGLGLASAHRIDLVLNHH